MLNSDELAKLRTQLRDHTVEVERVLITLQKSSAAREARGQIAMALSYLRDATDYLGVEVDQEAEFERGFNVDYKLAQEGGSDNG